jgi:hypothetical protein
MFHSSGLKDDGDVTVFYEETSAVTAILMLLTLRDLGVDLGLLSRHYAGIGDFRQFMKERSVSGAAATEKEARPSDS